MVVHVGVAGQGGSVGTVRRDEIEDEIAYVKSRGFTYDPAPDFLDMSITFTCRDGDLMTPAWLKARHDLQDRLDGRLRWTGNGEEEGGDSGQYEVCVFCMRILDRDAAESLARQLIDESPLSRLDLRITFGRPSVPEPNS